MVQNGPKWFKMAKMVQSGQKRFKQMGMGGIG
jgi:hypothetical protein